MRELRERCSLVRDLLPLYIDGLVGEDSIKIIEAHLDICASCKEQYEAMGTKAKIETNSLQDVKRPFLRIKRFYITRTLLAVLVLTILAVPAYLGFNALRGQGVTFTSFTAASYANRAFDALKDGNYPLAAEYFDDDHSQNFLQALESLEEEGIIITNTLALWRTFSHSGNHTSGQVIVRMEHEGESYDVYFLVGYRGKKITPQGIMHVTKSLPGYRMANIHWRSEWPEWVHELNHVLGSQDSRVAKLVEISILRSLDGVTRGQKLNSDLWQLPRLNAVSVNESEAVFLYFTTPSSTVTGYFEENILPDLYNEAQARGISVVMVVWPQVDNIATYASMDFPVFLGNQDYIVSESIKGFPTLRLYSKDHKLLWEQLGLRGNEELSFFDPVWDLLES